ncbi:hypothetical protein NL393_32450, partial [Klebsiella pneumoniae]|nr:hypothetical protein [Klebsiella pneumoniae]
TMSDASQQRDFISLKLHSRPATIAEAAACEVARYVICSQGQSGWRAFYKSNKRFAVRFTRGSPTKHRYHNVTFAVLLVHLGAYKF